MGSSYLGSKQEVSHINVQAIIMPKQAIIMLIQAIIMPKHACLSLNHRSNELNDFEYVFCVLVHFRDLEKTRMTRKKYPKPYGYIFKIIKFF